MMNLETFKVLSKEEQLFESMKAEIDGRVIPFVAALACNNSSPSDDLTFKFTHGVSERIITKGAVIDHLKSLGVTDFNVTEYYGSSMIGTLIIEVDRDSLASRFR